MNRADALGTVTEVGVSTKNGGASREMSLTSVWLTVLLVSESWR